MSFNIWNNIDETGLYYSLERLDSETDESFYNRIKHFSKWKFKTDYLTLSHSIPIQLGMYPRHLVKIKSDTNYTCVIEWDYFYLSNDVESLRVFIGEQDCTLDKILKVIDTSDSFTYTLYDESARKLKTQFLIRNSNVKINKDYVDSTQYKLDFSNIVLGSVKSNRSSLLKVPKQDPSQLKTDGDYFVDYKNGYIEIFSSKFNNGEFVYYKYYDESFFIESTPINLMPANQKFKYGLSDTGIELMPYLLNKKVWS